MMQMQTVNDVQSSNLISQPMMLMMPVDGKTIQSHNFISEQLCHPDAANCNLFALATDHYCFYAKYLLIIISTSTDKN